MRLVFSTELSTYKKARQTEDTYKSMRHKAQQSRFTAPMSITGRGRPFLMEWLLADLLFSPAGTSEGKEKLALISLQ